MSHERLLPHLGRRPPPEPPIRLQERQTGHKDVPMHLYAQEVAKLVVRLEKTDKFNMNNVKKFGGFTENAYRYLFAYEDNFPDQVPHLKTILPSGKIENEKDLKPEKERGIIAYTYSQKMWDQKLAQTLMAQRSPFVWEKEKGGEPHVMQTWPTKFNDKFKKDFELYKYPNNPDPKHFEVEALEDFKRVALTMFRPAGHEDPPIWLCVRRSDNEKHMYQGKGFQLMALLRLCRDIREELEILEILEPDGFVSKFTTSKETGEKTFHMDLNNSYCLYTKQGFETMACVKPLEQFNWEANRHDELDIPEFSDDGVISLPLDMEWVSGPAYVWAWKATVVIWGGAIFTVIFAYFFYQRADWWEKGVFSDWVQHLANTLTATLIVCAIVFSVYADDRAMSYCIVPWLQNVEKKSCMIPFFGQRSCNEFRYFSLLCTLSQMMTIQLNAWVLANTVRNSNCQTETAYEWLWKQGGIGFCPISLTNSLMVCWCLSALQMVVPTFYTLSHDARQRRTDLSIPKKVEVNRNNDSQSYKFNCKSLLSGSLTEGVTLMALAAGMRYTGAMALSYPLATIKRIKGQQIGFLTKKEGEAWEPTPHGWQFRCVKELQKLYSIQVKRVWFNLVFKYSLQMNTQVTLFILKGASETTAQFNYGAAFGELMSLGAMMLGIASELFDLKTLLSTFWDVRAIVNECFKQKEEAEEAEKARKEKKKEEEAQKKEGGEQNKDSDDEKGWGAKRHQWVTALTAPHIPWPCHRKAFMQDTLAHHFFEGQDEEEKLTYDDLNKEYWRVLGVTISIVLILMFSMWLIGYEMLKFVNYWVCPSNLWSWKKGCLPKASLEAALKTNCWAANSTVNP